MENKIAEVIKDLSQPAEQVLAEAKEILPGAEKYSENVSEITRAMGEQDLFPTVQADAAGQTPPTPAVIAKTPLALRVESIMEEGIAEIYQTMDKPSQLKFKNQGEATALKIISLMSQAKYQVKKIFDLIVDWLKIIPGVNQFFLEQEAKIKTDRIVALQRDKTQARQK